MKTSKKSKFLTFCLSLFPGAAHMYMGFMKMGISLMGLFIIAISIAGMLDVGILILVNILIWFYAFFHANNLAYLSDEAFAQVEDNFLFGIDTLNQSKITAEKYRKYLGIGLIVFGTIMIWNITMNRFMPRMLDYFPDFIREIFWRIRSLVPQLVFGIVVIAFGVKMLRGKNDKSFDKKQDGQYLSDKEHGEG